MSMEILISGLALSAITLLPLAMKWELEKRVAIPTACLIGILSGAAASAIVVFWDLAFYQIVVLEICLITAMAMSLLLWRFYRDPERVCSEDENAVLSPADGEIIYVKKIEDGEIPFSEKNGRRFPLNEFVQSDVVPQTGHLVGIAMNFLDVHVNRAPIGGRIRLLKHIKGLFISLKREEAVVQNERALTVIDNGHFKIGIVQIASRLVRKIVPYIQEGQEIQRGERIGVIRFGSQVDLILPDLPSLLIKVNPGEKVEAGLSIVASLGKNEGEELF